MIKYTKYITKQKWYNYIDKFLHLLLTKYIHLSDFIINKFKNKIIKNIISLPLYIISWFSFIIITLFLKPCSCSNPNIVKTHITNTLACSICMRLFDFSDIPNVLQLMTKQRDIINNMPKKYKDNPEIALFIKVNAKK